MASEAERETAEALKALAAEAKKATDAAKKQREESKKAYDQARAGALAGASGVLSGGVGTVSQAGSNGADAAFGALQGLSRGLPAIGAALGTIAGFGPIIGGLAGKLGSAAIDRVAGPTIQAREQAIGEVSRLGAARAAAGQALSPEATAALLEAAMTRALRTADYGASVRNAADLSVAFRARGGR